MNEIERAIKGFENELRGMQNSEPRYMAQKRQDRRTERINTALTVLRAELARQDAKPLACDGCKDQEDMYVGDTMCYDCRRFTTLPDRYEPKGESK